MTQFGEIVIENNLGQLLFTCFPITHINCHSANVSILLTLQEEKSKDSINFNFTTLELVNVLHSNWLTDSLRDSFGAEGTDFNGMFRVGRLPGINLKVLPKFTEWADFIGIIQIWIFYIYNKC